MNIKESSQWEDSVTLLTRQQRVEGGQDGAANIQAKELANRTAWLKDQLEGISDYREYTFYATAGDPDGTVSGLQKTPNGKMFRVALIDGNGQKNVFKYYRNDNGKAVYINSAPSFNAVDELDKKSAGQSLALQNVTSGLLTALAIIDNTLNNVAISVSTNSASADSFKEMAENRLSGVFTSIAAIVNTMESLSILLDKNYVTIPAMNEDRLNLLMLSSRLLKILDGLDGFDPGAVLTRADIDEVGGGDHETVDGVFTFLEPTSLVTIDLTADKIPGSKDEGDVSATAVITLDGAVFSARCKISVQGASSAAYPKKNLSLEFFDKDFDNNIELKIGNLRPHDTWVYKANWVDSTQCRNLMSYRLWQAFQASRPGYPKYDIDATYVGKKGKDGFPTGATAVPAGYPCVMHINGEFYGIGTFLIGKKRGNYNLPKDSPLQIQLDLGQWLLINSMEENHANENILEFKAPKTVTEETVAALREWDSFAGADANYFAGQVQMRMDKRNLIDFYLFVTYIAAADLVHNANANQVKNMQMVTWDGVKWFFMPYDLDTVFGNNWAGGYSYKPTESIPWCAGSFWDNVRAVYGNDIAARYKELRDKKIISADWVYDMSTHIQARYPADAYEDELAKWSVTTPALPYVSNNGRDQLVTWAKARIAAMDTYFNYAE